MHKSNPHGFRVVSRKRSPGPREPRFGYDITSPHRTSFKSCCPFRVFWPPRCNEKEKRETKNKRLTPNGVLPKSVSIQGQPVLFVVRYPALNRTDLQNVASVPLPPCFSSFERISWGFGCVLELGLWFWAYFPPTAFVTASAVKPFTGVRAIGLTGHFHGSL